MSTSDLDRLAADLTAAGPRALQDVKGVVERGCLNIKTDWQQGWSGLAHAPALPAAITYTTSVAAGVVSGEVGPDKSRKQGALGNLLEFGSAHNPPHPAGQNALDREESKFISALESLPIALDR